MSIRWTGEPIEKSQLTSAARQAIADQNPSDMLLWNAASAYIDKLVAHEKELDGDGGRQFDIEETTFSLLQRQLKQLCHGTKPRCQIDQA